VWKFNNVSRIDSIPIFRVLLVGTESVPETEHYLTMTLLSAWEHLIAFCYC